MPHSHNKATRLSRGCLVVKNGHVIGRLPDLQKHSVNLRKFYFSLNSLLVSFN